MVAPATALGIDLLLFAQSPDDSGAQITHHIVGDYADLEALKVFASNCDVITFEHELVFTDHAPPARPGIPSRLDSSRQGPGPARLPLQQTQPRPTLQRSPVK